MKQIKKSPCQLIFIFILFLLISENPLLGESVNVAPSSGNQSTLPTQLQTQTHQLLLGVFQSILPKFNMSAQSIFGQSPCPVQTQWSFSGISFVYTHTSSCPLGGTVTMSWFPMGLTFNLDVYDIPNISKLEFNSSLNFSFVNSNMVMDITFLDGTINITLPNQAPTPYILNGDVKFSIGLTSMTIQGRENVFQSSSLAGFSLVSSLTIPGNISQDSLSFCGLIGGNPNNPYQGTLTSCLGVPVNSQQAGPFGSIIPQMQL